VNNNFCRKQDSILCTKLCSFIQITHSELEAFPSKLLLVIFVRSWKTLIRHFVIDDDERFWLIITVYALYIGHLKLCNHVTLSYTIPEKKKEAPGL